MAIVAVTTTMLDVSRKATRFRFGIRHLLLLVAIASVAAFLGSIAWQQVQLAEQQAQRDDEVERARINLKRIVLALQAYQDAHRTLPYSDKGDVVALFALRQQIAPAAFECRSHDDGGKPRARWDTGSGRLVNGDVVYLNEPNARLDSSRIIVACDLDNARQLYATGNSVVHGRKGPIPTSELLGSWVTGEGFVVADKATFDKWQRSYPSAERGAVHGIGGQPEPIETTFKDGSAVRYIYANGKLNRREITTRANGSVLGERIETDRYGRIVGISRLPE